MSAEARLHKTIADNVANVRARIASAAERSGRSANDVTLVAVTKYVGPAETQAVIDAGCFQLGESRPQDLWDKAAGLNNPAVHWHMIGHLQRNKVRRTLPLATLIHSVDSERLLLEIDRAAAELQQIAAVLLEVNVSGDVAKHGFQPVEMEPLLARAASFSHLQIQGLMAMSGLESDDARTCREFESLRILRDRLVTVAPPNVTLRELSMGMSGDFELGIAAGATLVRIGSALFAGLES